MSTVDDTVALLALCNTIKPTYEPGRAPDGVTALAILHGGTATPSLYGRRIDGRNRRRSTVHHLVCVGNTRAGAANLARLMADAIDGTVHDQSPWLVLHVSSPIPDRTDQSAASWSSTVEVHHHTRRS